MRHVVIAVYAVTDKGPSQRMRWLLSVPFERTPTPKELPPVLAERNLQRVRFHSVTVPPEVLSNPETTAEQNRH
jgi:hypothetical protein